MQRRLGWRTVLVLAVVAGAVALAISRPVRLGLDLRGGTQIVLEAEGERISEDTVDRTLEVLRRRVDQLGVSEPTLQRSGDRRVIIELPGVSDPEEALKVIGRTAQLAFHQVADVAPPPASPAPAEEPQPPDEELVMSDESGSRLRLEEAAVTGDAIGDARATFNQAPPGWTVLVTFRGEGGDQFERLTGQAACAGPGDPRRRIAIVLDREIISSPEVGTDVACNQGIAGETVITGGFSEDEARELALLIRAGALPVPVDVVEQRTVGPTLGDRAVAASTQAALIGGLLTILYMIAYYRLLGGLAAIALIAYGVVSFAVLLAINATLTLPGIAGFVLAIGMAVDANVLVFERMKEEHTAGKAVRSAATRGFSQAWSAIADSNATTVIAALLLFWFATGAVRGFGITLTIGVAVSMFSALVITRVLVDWVVVRSTWVKTRPRMLGLTMGGALHRWLSERGPDVIGRRRIWFAVSAAALVLAVAGIFGRGLNFGVEFTGGELAEYETARRVDLNDLRTRLAAAGFPRAIVQESGEGNVSVRTGRLSATEEEELEQAVSAIGGRTERVRSEFVGPTIGAELRRKALIALGAAILVQLLYLAVRFRWTYGASAVVAMVHDVVLLIGVFAWLGKEFDGVFLASLLTVIGYSINDSVVVFDRIREQRRLRSREPLAVVANDACLQTIPRTINTGLGAVFILVALFMLGGDTLTDFALALLVGIGVGTYSSVFTASPLVVAMERGGAASVQGR